MNHYIFPGLTSHRPIHFFLSNVAVETGLTVDQIKSRDKTEYICLARHIFCWYAINKGCRYDEIAEFIGRHRTTVLHSEKLVKGLIAIRDWQALNIIKRLNI